MKFASFFKSVFVFLMSSLVTLVSVCGLFVLGGVMVILSLAQILMAFVYMKDMNGGVDFDIVFYGILAYFAIDYRLVYAICTGATTYGMITLWNVTWPEILLYQTAPVVASLFFLSSFFLGILCFDKGHVEYWWMPIRKLMKRK